MDREKTRDSESKREAHIAEHGGGSAIGSKTVLTPNRQSGIDRPDKTRANHVLIACIGPSQIVLTLVARVRDARKGGGIEVAMNKKGDLLLEKVTLQ